MSDNNPFKSFYQKSSILSHEDNTFKLKDKTTIDFSEAENIPPKQKLDEKNIMPSNLNSISKNANTPKENNENICANFMFQTPLKKENIEGKVLQQSNFEYKLPMSERIPLGELNDGNIIDDEDVPFKTYIKPTTNKEVEDINQNDEKWDEEKNNILSQIPIRDYLNMNANFMVQLITKEN